MFKRISKFIGKEIVEVDTYKGKNKHTYIHLDSINENYILFRTKNNIIFKYSKECCRLKRIGKNIYELTIIVSKTYRIVFY